MSTVAPRSPAPPPIHPALLDSEGFIDAHIHRTRRALKLVDLAAGVITLALGLLVFLLIAGLIDHWVVPGGLGPAGRTAFFGLLIVCVGWYAWRKFAPLLRAINPVYAAHTIEKSAPSLKNSLLNALMFRTHRQHMPAKVFHALEQQAAQRLSATPVDAAIDRGALLRLGYALLAVVAVCALYSVLSPKNLAVSAGRVLAPWADLAPPSRVHIVNVEPGETSVARGERVTISADVFGAREDEPVRLRYSTEDEQLVDETIRMTRPDGGAARFTADLPRPTGPGGASGVQQDLEYWIEAGDGRSPRFKLSVFSRPTIVVQRVRYEYPQYTGLPPRVVDNVGDLRGIEGTRVTLEALANQPIKTALVDFDADGTSDLKMAVDDDRATASFTLELRPDRRTPLHLSYTLRFTTMLGRTNTDPAVYEIDVTPDYAPEVRITQPEEPEQSARADETVLIGVEASDPDYALAQVRLVGRVGDRDIVLGDMPVRDQPGRFRGIQPFVPADAQLAAGDVLEYWAEARDNRHPEANLATSEHRRLRIVDADAAEQQPHDRPQGGGNNQGEGAGQPGDQGQQEGEQGGAAGGNQSGEAEGEGEAQGESQQGPGAAGGQGDPDAPEGEGAEGEQSSGGGPRNGEQVGESGAGGGDNQGGESDEQGEQNPDASADGEPASTGGQSGDQQDPSDGESDPAEGAQDQGGEGSAGDSSGGQPERVSSAGDNDGEAIDRMRRHFAEQGADGEASGESGAEERAGDDPSGGAESEGGKTSEGENSDAEQSGAAAGADPQEGDAQGGESGAGESSDEQTGEQESGGSASDRDSSAEGQDAAASGERRGAAEADSTGDMPEGDGETPATADNGASPEGGEADAGDSGGETGAPEASSKKPGNQSSDSEPGESGAEPGTAESRGNAESDAEGDQGGDRPGDGQRGGGQQADSAGQGEAGSHEPSDTGAGQSSDEGAGETGAEAGDEQLADGETGQSSGDQAGEGGQTGDAEGEQSGGSADQAGDAGAGSTGEQSGGADPNGAGQQGEQGEQGEEGEQADTAGNSAGESGDSGGSDGEAASAAGQPGAEGDQSGATPEGSSPPDEGGSDQASSDAESSGGAIPGGSASSPPQGGGAQGGGVDGDGRFTEPGGDEANLDYARQQTDLVLERLDDQLARHQVDDELLKSLGWSEDELRQFVDRWKGLKARAAGEGDDAAEASDQLNAALRSLGLRREGPLRFRGRAAEDEVRDLNDAYRARAPMEYADRVRAYVKGAASDDE